MIMRVCFLLTHVPNPRINKRIEEVKKIAEVFVICTRRASQNIWEPEQNVEHIIFDIDLPESNHLFKRYLVSRDYQKKAYRKLVEIKPDLIYAEGLDSLLIAKKYKQKHITRIIFEVADLRESFIVNPSGLIDKIVTKEIKRKERKLFGYIDNLVITSLKYYEVHYKHLISKEKVIYIPNIPDVTLFKNFKKKQGGIFTIGFIGGIRYLDQMKMLVDAAGILNVRVLFAGAGGTSNDFDKIQKYCHGKDYVTFSGRYNYTSDIVGLYENVDCVYAVYDADNPNVRIALPNKLYESMICELPILVAQGTYLSELVETWGVGLTVDHKSVDDLIFKLEKLITDQELNDLITTKCREWKETILPKQKNDDFKNTIRQGF